MANSDVSSSLESTETNLDFNLCILCQEVEKEPPVDKTIDRFVRKGITLMFLVLS